MSETEPVKKEETETKQVEVEQKIISQVSSKTNAWLLIVVILAVLLIGAIYAGQQAERVFGDAVYNVLPETMKKKDAIDPEIKIHPELKDDGEKPNEKIIPPLLPSPTPDDDAQKEDDEEEPFVVPDGDGDSEESTYLLPSSDSTKLTKEDLVDLSDFDLKKARNEIYARHGRPFVHKDMQCYFSQQSWYTLDPEFKESSLSSVETSNAVFILNYEKERQSPYVAKDIGCNAEE